MEHEGRTPELGLGVIYDNTKAGKGSEGRTCFGWPNGLGRWQRGKIPFIGEDDREDG